MYIHDVNTQADTQALHDIQEVHPVFLPGGAYPPVAAAPEPPKEAERRRSPGLFSMRTITIIKHILQYI